MLGVTSPCSAEGVVYWRQADKPPLLFAAREIVEITVQDGAVEPGL